MCVIDCAEVIPVKEKSVKHITKTLAVVSLLIPMSAQPLGIGDIELHSALNQKLNAEIRLNLAPGENPADGYVKLATP
jgi:pilus assembly protein FimV